MSDIASSKKKIQVEESQYRSAVSEATAQKVGGSINYLIDTTDNQESRISTIEGDYATNSSLFTVSTTTVVNMSFGVGDFSTFQTVFTVPANTLATATLLVFGSIPTLFQYDILGPDGGFYYRTTTAPPTYGLSALGTIVHSGLPPSTQVRFQGSPVGVSDTIQIIIREVSFK